MEINGKEFLLPLGVATPMGDGRYLVDQFLGSSFFVNGQGWIATCKHNLSTCIGSLSKARPFGASLPPTSIPEAPAV